MKIKNIFLKTFLILLSTLKINGMVPDQLRYKLIIIKATASEPRNKGAIAVGILLETNNLFLFRALSGFKTDTEFAYNGCLIFSDSRYESLEPKSIKFQKNGKFIVSYLSEDNKQIEHRFFANGTLDDSYEPQHAKFFTIKN